MMSLRAKASTVTPLISVARPCDFSVRSKGGALYGYIFRNAAHTSLQDLFEVSKSACGICNACAWCAVTWAGHIVQVTDGGQAVNALNELEWVEGEVWANIWLTDCIARIDPASGIVKCASLPLPCQDSAPTKSFCSLLCALRDNSLDLV